MFKIRSDFQIKLLCKTNETYFTYPSFPKSSPVGTNFTFLLLSAYSITDSFSSTCKFIDKKLNASLANR